MDGGRVTDDVHRIDHRRPRLEAQRRCRVMIEIDAFHRAPIGIACVATVSGLFVNDIEQPRHGRTGCQFIGDDIGKTGLVQKHVDMGA